MNHDNRNSFGLTERDMNTITAILKKYPELTLVHIFGSRAKGNYRLGSDIDLAVMNEGLNGDILRKLAVDFEESSLPYNVDILEYQTLQHPELRAHIERVGVEIYKAKEKRQLAQ